MTIFRSKRVPVVNEQFLPLYEQPIRVRDRLPFTIIVSGYGIDLKCGKLSAYLVSTKDGKRTLIPIRACWLRVEWKSERPGAQLYLTLYWLTEKGLRKKSKSGFYPF